MFSIVVCSSNRLDLFKKKTLKFIKNNFDSNIPVYIFTPQFDEYFNDLIGQGCIVIKTREGLNKARFHSRNYFKPNDKLLYLDDDIDDILTYDNSINIEKEFETSFKYMESNNIKLGSINPTSNKYFSNGEYKFGLYFCIGCCYMYINDRTDFYTDDELQLFEKSELEDYERSIYYFKKYHNNFRNDRLFIKTKYNQKGGMYSETRNEDRTRRAIELFLKYPEYLLLKKKKNYLGIILKRNTKNRLIDLEKGGGLRGKESLNGLYPNINLENKLDIKSNYIFKLDGKVIGYLIRNLYEIKDFKITMKNNQNSGDIAGRIEKDKLQNCARKYYEEFKFNKFNTRTKKSDKHKFEMSNTIKRISGKIESKEIIKKIYNDIKNYNILGSCNYYTCNKDLQSAYHKDYRNKSPFVILLTINNNLDLHIPELDLEINNRDNDIVVFDLKNYFHANTKGKINNRYSIVYFEK